jgi:hypothetical protein
MPQVVKPDVDSDKTPGSDERLVDRVPSHPLTVPPNTKELWTGKISSVLAQQRCDTECKPLPTRHSPTAPSDKPSLGPVASAGTDGSSQVGRIVFMRHRDSEDLARSAPRRIDATVLSAFLLVTGRQKITKAVNSKPVLNVTVRRTMTGLIPTPSRAPSNL